MMHVIQCFIFFIAMHICQSSNLKGKNHGAIEEYDSSSLRYVAFGTSITYGTGVGREDRYTNLLSSNVTNLGMRGSDPSYPSICTQSMSGDAIYDVIIVEYHMAYHVGLKTLVQRIRERFVDATIIAVNLWMCRDVNVVDDKGEKLYPFITWLHENGYYRNTPEARDFVKESNVNFAFNTKILGNRDICMDELVKDYNVKLCSWIKKSSGPTVKALLLRYMPYYTYDLIHWSESGHRLVAQKIVKIVKEEKTKVSNRVGSWGAGDKCMNWQSKGKIVGNMPTSGKMKQFSSKGKFALEFAHGEGFINIENPFSEPRELALTYMVIGPASIYPKTKISIKSSGQESIIIDPTDTTYDFPVHVQHTTVVGKVNPGMNMVLITPLERKENPFRLVGYAMAPKIQVRKVWSGRLRGGMDL